MSISLSIEGIPWEGRKIINSDKLPYIIIEYLKNVTTLEFDEKPNYSILIDMFKREIDTL